MIMVISPAVKVGCAGDERLFAGAEGLLQRHRLSGLEHPQGAGAVNHAGSDNLLHALPSTSSRRRPGTSS